MSFLSGGQLSTDKLVLQFVCIFIIPLPVRAGIKLASTYPISNDGLRYAITNDVNKYAVTNNLIWIAITNEVIIYKITNYVIRYAITNDGIKFEIKNDLIKYAIKYDVINKKINNNFVFPNTPPQLLLDDSCLFQSVPGTHVHNWCGRDL